MSDANWKITFQVHRQKGQQPSHYEEFVLDVDPHEYVLAAIERIWAYHDRSLTFAHACHHATCGACGMRINGKEKLACITQIREVATDGNTLKIAPLRNFPVISDLVVDMGRMYTLMDIVEHRPVLPVAEEPARSGIEIKNPSGEDYLRLSDCIECGLCISACPIATTSTSYLGPAALAGGQQHGLHSSSDLLALVDSADGVWRCHSAFECNEVCPSNVEPGTKIMQLRRSVIAQKLRNLIGSGKN